MQTDISVPHACWWTRRRETELVDYDGELSGAGITAEVLARTAVLVEGEFTVRPSTRDEYGKDVFLGAVVTGSTHDDCFFRLAPCSARLKRALLESVLALHSSYLRKDVDWSGAVNSLLHLWMPGTTLRIRANDRHCRVSVQSFRTGATFFERLFNKSRIVDCATGVGLLR
jgi:hypothetical protein